MPKNTEILKQVFEKTDGYCHICHKKLSFRNYGNRSSRGCWEKEHSRPRAKGGGDSLRNLLPACPACNQRKGTRTSRAARAEHGHTRAPLSKRRKASQRKDNITAGAIVGGLLGLAAGPFGMLLGATVGGMVGKSKSPKK